MSESEFKEAKKEFAQQVKASLVIDKLTIINREYIDSVFKKRYIIDKENIKNSFYEKFEVVTRKAKKLQKLGLMGDINFITISFLETSTINRTFEYMISVWDEYVFSSNDIAAEYWKPDFIFEDMENEFNNFHSEIMQEIETPRFTPIIKFELMNIYAKQYCFFSIKYLEDIFQDKRAMIYLNQLKLNDKLSFLAGDFRGKTTLMFEINTKEQNN